MFARSTRVVTVTNQPTQIRDTVTKRPIAFSQYRYASGGANVEVSTDAGFEFGEGRKVEPDSDYNDVDRSHLAYMITDGADVDVYITDFEE